MASTVFDDPYRQAWPARQPKVSDKNDASELVDLSQSADFFSVDDVYVAALGLPGMPPKGAGDQGTNKYLWLIRAPDVRSALENGTSGNSVKRGYLAHTNISGSVGSDLNSAHCGGEMWFDDDNRIWLTGGSGRFPPSSGAELDEVVRAFTKSGYSVCSAGWNDEAASVERFFRGTELWT